MIKGVKEGYSKTLDIIGVGYKAEQKGKNILLTIGLSHPIYFATTGYNKVGSNYSDSNKNFRY